MAPFLFLTGPKSKNYGATVEATHEKKAKWQRRTMKREFLEAFGLEKETVDKILDENSRDIGREKAKTETAKQELSEAQGKLETAQADLEVLKKNGGSADDLRKQLEELQKKYETDTEALNTKLADRDYSEAITRSIASTGLKFSSKAAERDFVSRLMEKRLELKDGKLEGWDDHVKAQRETEPDTFAPDKTAPRIVSRVGAGGAPQKPASRAAQIAAEYNKNLYGTQKESE